MKRMRMLVPLVLASVGALIFTGCAPFSAHRDSAGAPKAAIPVIQETRIDDIDICGWVSNELLFDSTLTTGIEPFSTSPIPEIQSNPLTLTCTFETESDPASAGRKVLFVTLAKSREELETPEKSDSTYFEYQGFAGIQTAPDDTVSELRLTVALESHVTLDVRYSPWSTEDQPRQRSLRFEQSLTKSLIDGWKAHKVPSFPRSEAIDPADTFAMCDSIDYSVVTSDVTGGKDTGTFIAFGDTWSSIFYNESKFDITCLGGIKIPGYDWADLVPELNIAEIFPGIDESANLIITVEMKSSANERGDVEQEGDDCTVDDAVQGSCFSFHLPTLTNGRSSVDVSTSWMLLPSADGEWEGIPIAERRALAQGMREVQEATLASLDQAVAIDPTYHDPRLLVPEYSTTAPGWAACPEGVASRAMRTKGGQAVLCLDDPINYPMAGTLYIDIEGEARSGIATDTGFEESCFFSRDDGGSCANFGFALVVVDELENRVWRQYAEEAWLNENFNATDFG